MITLSPLLLKTCFLVIRRFDLKVPVTMFQKRGTYAILLSFSLEIKTEKVVKFRI